MFPLYRFAANCWLAALSFGCRVASAAFSNRALAIWTFLGCGLLIVGPWLRSSISRDFRGIHIPWTDGSNEWFLPEYVVAVPRAWQWNSIATPLLVVVAAGI